MGLESLDLLALPVEIEGPHSSCDEIFPEPVARDDASSLVDVGEVDVFTNHKILIKLLRWIGHEGVARLEGIVLDAQYELSSASFRERYKDEITVDT